MKKLKKPKVKKLTEEDYIQALDYSYVMMVAFYNTLSVCDAVTNNDVVKKQFELVGEVMANFYQTIGQEASKDET